MFLKFTKFFFPLLNISSFGSIQVIIGKFLLLKENSWTLIDENENLLALAVKAARARATLGEISKALEDVFERHTAQNQSVMGVYKKQTENDEN